MCGRGVRGCAGVMGAKTHCDDHCTVIVAIDFAPKTHFLPRSIWRGTSGRAGDMVYPGRLDSRDLQKATHRKILEVPGLSPGAVADLGSSLLII